MEFRYSEVVDPSLFETDGLITNKMVTLRRHKDSFSEIIGAFRAQRDWSEHVAPVHGYQGGLGEHFSFIRVTVPECLPERLEVVSYANEYAFLYDDEMEMLDLKQLPDTGGPGILETFGTGVLDHNIEGSLGKLSSTKRLQARVLAEMIAIDAPRAKTTMEAWARFVQLASRTRLKAFDTLAQYIPARVIDCGELIWFGTLTYGMGLTIPDDEYHLCMKLARPGYVVLALTNDLYSWEKERQAAEQLDQDHVFNAIWVIMKERGVDENEAKAICTEVTRDYIDEYCSIVERTRTDAALSKDVRAYIEAVLLSIAGNLVWSIYCPRYRQAL
ncbi:isoprenoid synthase domain-containing protein [Lasiosphaeria miniovina]|uniref:Isoprenoid synthase domain-containing protein n=1 Tax=Lasiosphaeria miniovina TaxID=1954250 RepID=A0AA39ZR50_9PEZI|nr:isoprenoid synthase domain-containing protein [Lasiosphaeria miniovina]KAK0701925.1 isoprenoid synthase domain-containing protein [Lasiosphaeria miniovina]